MTRNEIATHIQHNLNDEGVTYYSLEDLFDSIQDGYDEIAVYCECIEKSVVIELPGGRTFYDFSVLIPDYYRIIRIYSDQIHNFLDLNLERENLGYADDWMLHTGSARDFVIKGPKYIGISNRPAVLPGTGMIGKFKIWYKAQADKLTESFHVPRINSKFQILLEHYGTADLLEQNQEYTKATTYWLQYVKGLEDYREKIKLLAKADHIFSRDEIDF